MSRWIFCLIGFGLSMAAQARDLVVGWDNANTVGIVEYYELFWRNPTTWAEVTLRNPTRSGVEFDSSRVYTLKNVVPGTLEVIVRACSDSATYRDGESCVTGMTEGFNSGCCSDWATLNVTIPSTPTKPVITP